MENEKEQNGFKSQAGDLLKMKGVIGVVKIALIFVGVLVVLVVAIPLAPFVTFYFYKDRKYKHVELMAKVNKVRVPQRDALID